MLSASPVTLPQNQEGRRHALHRDGGLRTWCWENEPAFLLGTCLITQDLSKQAGLLTNRQSHFLHGGWAGRGRQRNHQAG